MDFMKVRTGPIKVSDVPFGTSSFPAGDARITTVESACTTFNDGLNQVSLDPRLLAKIDAIAGRKNRDQVIHHLIKREVDRIRAIEDQQQQQIELGLREG